MTGSEFNDHWRAHYGNCPPIGHVLRQRFTDHWMRIHSLPDAQRYPADADDWATLLARQNQLCGDLLGAGEEFLLVGGDYFDIESGNYGVEGALAEQAALAGITLALGWRVNLHRVAPEHYDPDLRFDVAFSPQVWREGRWDEVLRAIAEDELRVLFLSTSRGCLIAPYDGGVDVILADTNSRDACRQRYQGWLSPHPSGL